MPSPHLSVDPDAPRWSGPPVVCPECQQSGVPVYTQVGWTFPPHRASHVIGRTWCRMSAEALPGQDQLPGPALL